MARTDAQVPYEPPHIPQLLSISAFLYLISFTSSLFSTIINASLIGPLLIGIIFGPAIGGLVPQSTQSTFIDVGYVALLLIVFEAGLTTDVSLLMGNIVVSIVAALTGIGLPIAFSMALLGGGYGYTTMQAFAGGAALSSTSLGTTLALLTPELKRTRVGSILMSAALLDDIVGLVIAAIIPNLASTSSSSTSHNGISWQTIVRPIFVSLAFGILCPLLAYGLRKVHLWLPLQWRRWLCDLRVQLFLIVLVLSAFVAGSKYAGTSELFGAYLAGTFMAYIFENFYDKNEQNNRQVQNSSSVAIATASTLILSKPHLQQPTLSIKEPTATGGLHEVSSPTLHAYTTHIEPLVLVLLGPIFFASIGAAIPIGALFTVNGGHAVVWRGLVYSLLMILSKMAVGVWMLVWPEPGVGGKGWFGMKRSSEANGDGLKDDGSKLEEGRSFVPTAALERSNPGGLSEEIKPQPQLNTAESRNLAPSWITPYVEANQHKVDEVPPPEEALTPSSSSSITNNEPTRTQSAALLALAMVARGEIALIVAQLARPMLLGLDGQDEEPFAVVIWGILVSTIGGALGVGLLLRSWKKKDQM